MCICICERVYACRHMCMCIHICILIYIYIYLYIYTMYMCIYLYSTCVSEHIERNRRVRSNDCRIINVTLFMKNKRKENIF